MDKVTLDQQEFILAILMGSSDWFSKTEKYLTDKNFDDPSCKIIYKAVEIYYKKYNTVPTIKELMVSIDKAFDKRFDIELIDVKHKAIELDDTKISNNEVQIIDELKSFILATNMYLTVNDFLEKANTGMNLNLENIHDELVRCTEVTLENEKVYTMNADNYIERRKQSIGDGDNSYVIKSSINSINQLFTYGGYRRGTLHMIVAPPGVGKSTFLICEGAFAARQGFHVLHIFIGDLAEFDGMTRYYSLLSGVDINIIPRLSEERINGTVNQINLDNDDILTRLHTIAYPTYSVKVETLQTKVEEFQRQLGVEFSMIIVDYPDNLQRDSGITSFQDGGNIYGHLEALSKRMKVVTLLASQPPKEYWSCEIIPKEGAAESSKKQHIVDTMFTMNLHGKGSSVGTIYIAKSRNGTPDKCIRFKTEYKQSRIKEISDTEYTAIISKEVFVEYGSQNKSYKKK